jgi:hypothetical protein
MLRKLFSLGALIVVAVAFGVGNAAAKPSPPSHGSNSSPGHFGTDGFSDGRD